MNSRGGKLKGVLVEKLEAGYSWEICGCVQTEVELHRNIYVKFLDNLEEMLIFRIRLLMESIWKTGESSLTGGVSREPRSHDSGDLCR